MTCIKGTCRDPSDAVAHRAIAPFGRKPLTVTRSARCEPLDSQPGLADLLTSNVRQGRLAFDDQVKPAVGSTDVVFIAVGTPSRRGDGHADLSCVFAAAREIAGSLSNSPWS